MPVTIQPASMKIKNGNTFTAVDCLKGDNVDVRINNTSITSNGVANIPVADSTHLGVVLIPSSGARGIDINASNELRTRAASATEIKSGTDSYKPIVPNYIDAAVYYGLSKLAGVNLASETVTVGTYPASSKSAIQSMLGITVGASLIENVSGATPTIAAQPNVRYICGTVSTINITPPTNGTCDVIFTSGSSTASVLTVPNTVKFPSWFDATALSTDKIYEIMITDGVYGSVMTWDS